MKTCRGGRRQPQPVTKLTSAHAFRTRNLILISAADPTTPRSPPNLLPEKQQPFMSTFPPGSGDWGGSQRLDLPPPPATIFGIPCSPHTTASTSTCSGVLPSPTWWHHQASNPEVRSRANALPLLRQFILHQTHYCLCSLGVKVNWLNEAAGLLSAATLPNLTDSSFSGSIPYKLQPPFREDVQLLPIKTLKLIIPLHPECHCCSYPSPVSPKAGKASHKILLAVFLSEQSKTTHMSSNRETVKKQTMI